MARRRAMRRVFRTTARGSCVVKDCIRYLEHVFLMTISKAASLLLVALLAVASLRADGPFRNRDNKNAASDPGEGTYPIPYQLPTVAEITEALGRIRGYLETAAPT